MSGSPFGDGKSGAPGNSASGGSKHIGDNRPQKSGEPPVNATTVPEGGRIFAVDPPGDRDGLVGQTATGSGADKVPFKNMSGGLTGGETSNTASAKQAPPGTSSNEMDDHNQPGEAGSTS